MEDEQAIHYRQTAMREAFRYDSRRLITYDSKTVVRDVIAQELGSQPDQQQSLPEGNLDRR